MKISLYSYLLAALILHLACACTSAQYSANGVCYACSVTCLTCTSSTTSSCLTCGSSRFLNSFGACQCNAGYVEGSPVVALCSNLTCNYACLTCNNTATTCTSCGATSNRIYINSNSSCPCAAKYYDSGVATCAACHYSCTTCSGAAITNCLTCDSANAYRSLSSTSCPCLAGYYDDTTYVCSACSYKCLTCTTSATNCATCGSNRGASPSCLSSQGYYDDGVSTTAPPCNYTCQNCSDGLSCNLCNASNFRALSSLTPLCNCMARYFDAGVALCSACDPRCYTCLSTSVCLTCNSSAYRIYTSANKFCLCMTGYYQTSTTVQLCAACSSRCLTCLGALDNCTTCDPSMNRALSGNTCPCINGFYENAFLTCSACYSTCYTCTNATACTACVASTLMTINSSSLCSCVSTLFFNTTVSICQSCNYQCATCKSTSPTLCLTCPASSHRTFASSACPCNTYFFDNGLSACAACHHSCRTCSAATASACTNCTAAAYRYTSGSSCLCQTLYYDNGALELCQPCLYNCLTCSTATSCSSCNTTLYRTLSTATPVTCVCISYYYEASQICLSCFYSCNTCNNNSTCLTCSASNHFRTFNTSTTLCDCLPGYYDNFVDRACLACLPQCLTCTNATTCTSCSSVAHRTLTSTFLCPCINLYFDLNGACTGCLYHCATCAAPTSCSTCNSSAYRLLSATGLCICADNYYDDGSHQLCLPCSYACLTCVSTAQTCTTCDTTLRTMSSSWCGCAQHFYDNNVTVACPPCQYTCSSCLHPNNCTTCNGTNQRFFDAINQYCICGVGYFDDGMDQTCAACNYRCYTCTNSSVCLTCSPTWFRATPASLCPCLDGYYDDGSSHSCLPCQYSCSTCTSGSQCLTCDATTNFRTFNTSTYLCGCIDRYYDDTFSHQLCQPCVYSCLTCAVVTSNCTSCNSSAYRTLLSGQCVCQQHFYDNLAELCLACPYSCSTCTVGNRCATCNATNQRSPAPSSGLCACNNQFWDDNTHQLCQPCEPTCLTCLGTASCTSCNSTRNRLLNSTRDFFNVSSPFCPCLYRYYSPAPNSDCQPCHYSCQVCTGPARTNCALCTDSALRFLNTSVTACQCLNGYYDNNSTQLCQLCNAACTTCTTGLPNSCTACASLYYHLVQTTTCFTTCPLFYFNLQTNWTCQPCSANCQTCLNSSYCSACASNYLLYANLCVSVCPPGTYVKQSAAACLNCPSGCSSCSGNSQCSACFSGYYFNSSLGFCFSCNSVCLTCTGPGQTECTTCSSPLFLQKGTCSILTCPSTTYIDPSLGCLPCNSLFPGSVLCNISQPFNCISSYLFSNNACLSCNDVQGYHLQGNSCAEICGDGLVIYLQCDDGNSLNGDGCSANCMIEKGWNCSNTQNTPSACTLIAPPTISIASTSKLPALNQIAIIMQLSLPILIRPAQLTLTLSGVDTKDYSYTVAQTADLTNVEIDLKYSVSLQGKSMQISYTQSRRLEQQQNLQNLQNQENQWPVQEQSKRMLTSLTFSSTISLDTYPPANYYPSTTLATFTSLQNYISALATALLVLCLILIPRRTHLHSLTLVYLPAQLFLTFCLLPSTYTDWLQFTLQNLARTALVGGFSLGQCCQSLYPSFSITSQIVQQSGIVLLVMLASWILLAVLFLFNRFCLNIAHQLKIIRYFIFTLNLALFFFASYAAMNPLSHYSLTTKTDAFNTILAILLNIIFLGSIGALWLRTYQIQILPINKSPKIYSIDNAKDVIFNLASSDKQTEKEKHTEKGSRLDDPSRRILWGGETETIQENVSNHSQLSETKTTHAEYEPLIFDYVTLYRHTTQDNHTQPNKSKYFLPLLITKLYLTALLPSFIQSAPLPCFILIVLTEAIFLVFLVFVRPFESAFTNFRLVAVSLALIASETVMCLYLYQSMQGNYSFLYEQLIIYLLLGLLAMAALVAFLEHVLGWRRQIWRKVFEPCLKGTRLMGTKRNSPYDFDPEPSEQADREEMKMTKSTFKGFAAEEDREEEMDAFYARMLKKEQLNKKYKKERMIK